MSSQPNKPLIIYNETVWTFQQVIFYNFIIIFKLHFTYIHDVDFKFENYGNKVANLFSQKYGLKKGDVVALFMENKPEYIGLWYGLSKLGVISALINTNLRNKTLLHSIEIAKPKVLVYAQELTDAVTQVKPSFSIQFEIINQAINKQSDTDTDNLESLLENCSDLFSAQEKVLGTDTLMFIYTVSLN